LLTSNSFLGIFQQRSGLVWFLTNSFGILNLSAWVLYQRRLLVLLVHL